MLPLDTPIPIPTLAETQTVAAQLARQAAQGDIYYLIGDLGAGKTTFARYFIQSLQESPEEVVSPTFTLMQPYETSKGTVCHLDLYRIDSEDDIPELGLEDFLDHSITLIEWPQRLGRFSFKDTICIHLQNDNDLRTCTISRSAE
jgi:tRNA threonylcarbamoyl adenosine modification protein YjeE